MSSYLGWLQFGVLNLRRRETLFWKRLGPISELPVSSVQMHYQFILLFLNASFYIFVYACKKITQAL